MQRKDEALLTKSWPKNNRQRNKLDGKRKGADQQCKEVTKINDQEIADGQRYSGLECHEKHRQEINGFSGHSGIYKTRKTITRPMQWQRKKIMAAKPKPDSWVMQHVAAVGST